MASLTECCNLRWKILSLWHVIHKIPGIHLVLVRRKPSQAAWKTLHSEKICLYYEANIFNITVNTEVYHKILEKFYPQFIGDSYFKSCFFQYVTNFEFYRRTNCQQIFVAFIFPRCLICGNDTVYETRHQTFKRTNMNNHSS